MAKFEITFERVATQTDRFTRIIEAENMEAAVERAHDACNIYDHDCPDDAKPFGGDECQSWDVHDATAAADDAEVDDLPGKHWIVELRADDVQVSAEREEDARRHAVDDARDFMADWNYSLVMVEETEDDLADDAGDADVTLGDPSGGEKDEGPLKPGPIPEPIWTFAPTFAVVVEAADERGAIISALRLFGVADPEAKAQPLFAQIDG